MTNRDLDRLVNEANKRGEDKYIERYTEYSEEGVKLHIEDAYAQRKKEMREMREIREMREKGHKVMAFNEENRALDADGNPYSEPNEHTIWKNPKPNTLNKKKIEKGDFVLVNGLPIMKEIIEVQDVADVDTGLIRVKIDNDGLEVEYNSTEVHPLYVQDIDKLKVGHVVFIKYQENPYIVASIENEQITTTNKKQFHKDDIMSVFGKTKKKEIYSKYSCGSIHFKDTEYKSLAELKRSNPGIAFAVNSEPLTLEHHHISSHFKIPSDELYPKEVEIEKRLKIALDHPLNVEAKEWALLVGESGSGKTEMAVNYAKSKKQKYIKQQGHSHLSGDDLIGYISITDGTYFRSLLREAVEKGHLFILDEIDACNPNTLLILNGLKQEYFQFPDKLVKIHENFRLIATANTLEYSEEYNARAQMDKATLARFDVIKYNMRGHELALRYGLKYVKQIDGIDSLSPREVARKVNILKIKEEIQKEAA